MLPATIQIYGKVVESLPAIIAAAAKSTLGILALMVILLSALAFVFFRQASEKVRIAVFAGLLGGVVCFGFATTNVQPSKPVVSLKDARPQVIAGTVVDQTTNRAIGQAQITLSDGLESATSDDSGNFSLRLSHEAGPVKVRVQKAGYLSADLTVEPPAQSIIVRLRKE